MYEVIAEHGLPAIFHSGHSGMGTGMPGGGGLRLKYSNPMHLDDVAADFPNMKIVIAHPSWPWQDEALSVCLHKPNVYIDLSGWSPKYFSPQLVQYANTMLKHKMLFGTDFPLITPDRWMDDFKQAGFRPEVHQLIFKDNAVRLLGLGGPASFRIEPILPLKGELFTLFCVTGSRNCDDYFSDLRVAFQIAVGLNNLIKGKCLRDHRLQPGVPQTFFDK